MNMTQFLVAEITGSILCNFYGEIADLLNPGDILFMTDAYCAIFQNSKILYCGKKGSIWRIGQFNLPFNETPFLSQPFSHS